MLRLTTAKFNRKPTTTRQRHDFREETIMHLAQRGVVIPKKPTKSFNRLLRIEIPKRRAVISAQEATIKNQEDKLNNQRAHQAARKSLMNDVDMYERKIYGGHSREDNPQTRARDARFAKDQRRAELERQSGTDLRDIVYHMAILTKGAELREKDRELFMELRQLYYGTPLIDSLFTLRVKNELIEAILKSETLLNGSE